MSQVPTPYSRQYNFTSFQTSNPTTPLPGQKVDQELNAVLTTLNATLSRLSEIQTDAGLVRTSALDLTVIGEATSNFVSLDAIADINAAANTAKTDSIAAINSAGSTQVSSVNAAGTAGVAAINAAMQQANVTTVTQAANSAQYNAMMAESYKTDADTARVQAYNASIDATNAMINSTNKSMEANGSAANAANHAAAASNYADNALNSYTNAANAANNALTYQQYAQQAQADAQAAADAAQADRVLAQIAANNFSLSIGSTVTGPTGSNASVSVVGLGNSAYQLNFTLPGGAVGPAGPAGTNGSNGATGATGATGPAGVVAASAPITYNSSTQTVGVDASYWVRSAAVAPADGQIAVWDAATGRIIWNNNFASSLESSVRNQTGATLTKGTVVYVSGASGNKPLVAKASASSESASSGTFAVITSDLPNNTNGNATAFGLLQGVNTAAYSEGASLWLSTTAGLLTTTRPAAPNHGVFVGTVTRSHATQGEILVRIQNGFEVSELHDSLITSPIGNDIFAYDSPTGLWKNKSIGSMGIATQSWVSSQGYLNSSSLYNALLDTQYDVTSDLEVPASGNNYFFTVSRSSGTPVNITFNASFPVGGRARFRQNGPDVFTFPGATAFNNKTCSAGQNAIVTVHRSTNGFHVTGDTGYIPSGTILSTYCASGSGYDAIGNFYSGTWNSTVVTADGSGGSNTSVNANSNGCWYPNGYVMSLSNTYSHNTLDWYVYDSMSNLQANGNSAYSYYWDGYVSDGMGNTNTQYGQYWQAPYGYLFSSGQYYDSSYGQTFNYEVHSDGSMGYYVNSSPA